MYKFIPLLFCLCLSIASCTHNNLEAHFQDSTTGWTKDQIFKRFGPPAETLEDSDFQYYVYAYKRPSKTKTVKSVVWQVRYVFENNKVIDVIEERVPTPNELDALDSRQRP